MSSIVGWRLVPLVGRDRTSGLGWLRRGSCGVAFAVWVVVAGDVLEMFTCAHVDDSATVLADDPKAIVAMLFGFADVSAAWTVVLHDGHLLSLSCRK